MSRYFPTNLTTNLIPKSLKLQRTIKKSHLRHSVMINFGFPKGILT